MCVRGLQCSEIVGGKEGYYVYRSYDHILFVQVKSLKQDVKVL